MQLIPTYLDLKRAKHIINIVYKEQSYFATLTNLDINKHIGFTLSPLMLTCVTRLDRNLLRFIKL